MSYENFERLLRERGVTSAQVSRQAHIPKSTLSSWKSGAARSLSAGHLQRLADYFGVPVEYFTTGDRTPRTYADPLVDEVARLASDDTYRELVVTINAATDEQRARLLSYARFLASEGKL